MNAKDLAIVCISLLSAFFGHQQLLNGFAVLQHVSTCFKQRCLEVPRVLTKSSGGADLFFRRCPEESSDFLVDASVKTFGFFGEHDVNMESMAG